MMKLETWNRIIKTVYQSGDLKCLKLQFYVLMSCYITQVE